MAIDKNYWRKQLPLEVAGRGGNCSVRVLTYDGSDFFVRQLMKSGSGYVILDVYSGSKGPIIASTSNVSDYDRLMSHESESVTLTYENIREVQSEASRS
jgi:hypothetical protein